MTSETTAHGTRLAKSVFKNRYIAERALAGCAMFLIALIPALVLAYLIDNRTVLEVNIWVKPIKFSIALALYSITLSLYCRFMHSRWRSSRALSGFTNVVIFTIVGEMVWLISAATLGEPAHFNQTHPIFSAVYFLMGVFATVLTSMCVVVGVGVLRNKDSLLRPLMRYSLGYGLLITFVLTMITAGYMAGAPAQSHAVPSDSVMTFSETDAIPLLGWLRNVGDLRVAHFFSSHALHGVPLVAWFLLTILPGRVVANTPVRARNISLALSGGYCLIVGYLFLSAIRGHPFPWF